MFLTIKHFLLTLSLLWRENKGIQVDWEYETLRKYIHFGNLGCIKHI